MMNMCCEGCLFGCGICEILFEMAEDEEDASGAAVFNQLDWRLNDEQ